jgi:hypothetical protein
VSRPRACRYRARPGRDVPADSVAIPDSVRVAFATRLGAERAATGRGPNVKLTPVDLADGVVLYQLSIRRGPPTRRRRDHRGTGVEREEQGSASRDAGLTRQGTHKAGRSCGLASAHGRCRQRAARGSASAWTPLGRDDAGVATGATALRERCRDPDAFEPVFSAAYRAELVHRVKREGLDVERVFSELLPATPRADLAGSRGGAAAYRRLTVLLGRESSARCSEG